MDAEGLSIPLPTLSQDAPGLFKASLNIVVPVEQPFDDPEDLTGNTSPRNGFYTHQAQDGRAFIINGSP
jgi:hypothetical protein